MRRSLLAASVVVTVAGCGGGSAPMATQSPRPVDFVAAQAPPAPAPVARAAKTPAPRFKTARVLRRTTLRATPGGHVVARIRRVTEFGSPRVLAVTGRRAGWLRVIASERTNEQRGWIRARAVRLGATDISIHVDRSARRLVVKRGSHVLRRMPIAVGRPGNETPLGRFAVTDLLRTGRADSPYGCCAVALSGHQTKLEPGWPGGDRLAIHATPQEETVGHAASLGCMRARTRDVRRLMRTVPVGTPVFVQA
jgi:lipoprotein-anchoring transpeptidase ErfK/SrfK